MSKALYFLCLKNLNYTSVPVGSKIHFPHFWPFYPHGLKQVWAYDLEI